MGVSALAVMAFAAQANAAEPLTVKLGGEVNFEAGMVDAKKSDAKYDFCTDSELTISADGKAANGLGYGASLTLDNGSGVAATDEAFVYLSGFFGKVELGDVDGAANKLAVFAPSVGMGQAVAEDDEGFRNWVGFDAATKAIDSDKSTKVSYFTPRVHGLMGGISYASSLDSMGEHIDADGAHVTEIAGNYQRSFRGLDFAGSIGYTVINAKMMDTSEHLQVGFKGAKVGGGYVESIDTDKSSWNIGATYELGSFEIGTSLLQARNDGEAEHTAYGVGGVYKVAPGLSVGADALRVVDDKTDAKGYVGVVQTKVAF
jgi:predicted porin